MALVQQLICAGSVLGSVKGFDVASVCRLRHVEGGEIRRLRSGCCLQGPAGSACPGITPGLPFLPLSVSLSFLASTFRVDPDLIATYSLEPK